MGFWDTLADLVSDAANTVSDAACSVGESMSDAASAVYDTMSDATSAVCETVGEAAGAVYDTVSDATSAAYDTVKDAPIGTAVGCAALGVAAVAAAPFTGGGSILGAVGLAASLSGAGTVAAAVGAGAVGAAVGASMAGGDYKKGVGDGRKAAKAEASVDISALKIKLSRAIEALKDAESHFDAIVAMEAVAVACANCDGEICAKEKEQIELFIAGVSRSSLPDRIKNRTRELYEKPLNISEAFILADKTGIEMQIFDEIVNLVIEADDIFHEQEQVFLQAWRTLRAA